MIRLSKKEDCCGCSACAQRCPKHCISMQEDEEGFLYPQIRADFCIDCGLCEKVCPVINQNESREPLNVYAAINPNEKIRKKSSSGGIFTMLAEFIIDQGGVVFGARWNENWEVVHDFTDKKEELAAFRSSKYLQSKINHTFKEAEKFLKENRKVLFVGTPCQIAGLKRFLRKDYENLLAVEVFCHSVPSPLIWREYLKELLNKIKWKREDLTSIDFRNKSTSWRQYNFVMKRQNGDIYEEKASNNSFMRGFLNDLYTRPSCHVCPAKSLKSGSDITIGDYWGIQKLRPDLDDDKGVSAIVINTQKGYRAFSHIENVRKEKMDYLSLCNLNPALIKSPELNQKRNLFFKNPRDSFFLRVEDLCSKPFIVRLKNRIKIICKRFFSLFFLI